jgi:predicted esterase YcpF (UPF0227 family)
MKKIIFIVVYLSIAGYVWGQNNEIRTPKDYLFCAEGAYDRKKGEHSNDTIPQRPEYLKKLTRSELHILNNNDFFTDIISGYAGAVFMDMRDRTIIIAHRGSEASDIRDFIADAQIVETNIVNKIITSIANKLRPVVDVNEMLEIGVQYPSAKKLIEAVIQQFPNNKIEQTGHSLGGSTTQLLAYEFGTKGVTFDPAGVGNKIYLDAAKKENVNNITNFKIHQSLISSSSSTGKNIGKIIFIYPTDGEKLNATKAHGTFDIYNQALNQNTGYFKTFDEVAQELWENNGTISEIIVAGIPIPTRAQTKIQDRFSTFSEYKEYLKNKYNISDQQEFNSDIDALNQNSVQFFPVNSNIDEGQTFKSTGSFVLLDNTIENGTYRIFEYKNRLYVLLNETDLLKITTEFLTNKSKQKTGTYQFNNDDNNNENENERDK